VRTIIGAKSFHGPVRDGKGWFQLAMVVRRKGSARLGAGIHRVESGIDCVVQAGCTHRLVKYGSLNTIHLEIVAWKASDVKVIGSSLTSN
jgi:hypothetical protein